MCSEKICLWVLIKLHRCAGRSKPLLIACGSKQVFIMTACMACSFPVQCFRLYMLDNFIYIVVNSLLLSAYPYYHSKIDWHSAWRCLFCIAVYQHSCGGFAGAVDLIWSVQEPVWSWFPILTYWSRNPLSIVNVLIEQGFVAWY